MFPPSSPDPGISLLHIPLLVFIPYKYYPAGHSILLAPQYYSFTITTPLYILLQPLYHQQPLSQPFHKAFGSSSGQDLGLTGSFTTRLFTPL